mgnify:FL=1
MNTQEKLEALRAEMKKRNIEAYVIPTDDFHGSEYVGDYFKCREYMSGFTGSAGTLVVTENEAALWTDGRYFIQAAAQLEGSTIELMKIGEKDVPGIPEYIAEKIAGTVGFDGRVVRESFAESLIKAFEQHPALKDNEDLVDLIWQDRPALSKEPVWEVVEEICGKSRRKKIEEVRAEMHKKGADFMVIAALDEIAWLLNLRGGDVESTPVFLAYLVIEEEGAALFADKDIFSAKIKRELKKDGIRILSYSGIERYIKKAPEGSTIWADPDTVNYRLMNCMEDATVIKEPNPIILMKAIKNEAERAGMIDAHIRDGLAMTRFLCWFKHNVGRERMTELSVTEKLHEFRASQEGFLDESFSTIMGYGEHGAIVHYSATEETDAEIFARGLLLIDSGGHFTNGTTDITRTVVCGELTEEEKKAFTLVLKGHLSLQSAHFRYGCGGEAFDILARQPLWDEGLDYNHGTGHGVGFILSVHEGPQRIHWKAGDNGRTPLEDGMVISDEPGVYFEGKFGVRHENLVLCETAEENEHGHFMHFRPLTMVPIDKEGIYLPYMDAADIERLNDYHRQVREALSPYLEDAEKEWLMEATSPLNS